MYCTGGIRCDVYSAFLKQKGFNNLYTLEGGVQGYFREEGGSLWNGSLFVFDGRMALPAAGRAAAEGGSALEAAVSCQLCGAAKGTLPHVNCANVDCNDLFIACDACKSRLSGCCCESCMAAPRLLRPVKLEGGHYGRWGNYADEDTVGAVMSTGRRREGRQARRARRREVVKERREEALREKAERKAMVRAAMVKLEEVEAQERAAAGGAANCSDGGRVAAYRSGRAPVVSAASAMPATGGGGGDNVGLKVCFACIQNAGRSQMAAAWLNLLVDASSARAVSAGSRPAAAVHPEVVAVMAEVGVAVGGNTPQKLTPELVSGCDLVVEMGCGEECLTVQPGKLLRWKLPDPHGKGVDDVRIIRDTIRAEVVSLAQQRGWKLLASKP